MSVRSRRNKWGAEPINGTAPTDTTLEKCGRVLIVVGGNGLAMLLGMSMSLAGYLPGAGRRGGPEWWAQVLKAAFLRPRVGPMAWTLLGILILGNVLNLVGLWPTLRRIRFSILRLLVVVGLMALVCAMLRNQPILGIVMIQVMLLLPFAALRRGFLGPQTPRDRAEPERADP